MSVTGYDPSEWPWPHVAPYEAARGWTTRLRAEGSREGKAIARELGVSWSTFKRMLVWYLVSVGEYRPREWLQRQRERRAESRRRLIAYASERDRKTKADHQALALDVAHRDDPLRRALAERARVEALEAEGAALAEPHVSQSRHSLQDEKERRRRAQRRLNAVTKARLRQQRF